MQRAGRAACAPCSPQLPPHPAARPGHHGECLGTGQVRGSAGAAAMRCGGMGEAQFGADGGRGGEGGGGLLWGAIAGRRVWGGMKLSLAAAGGLRLGRRVPLGGAVCVGGSGGGGCRPGPFPALGRWCGFKSKRPLGRRERREAAPGVCRGERRLAVPPGRGSAVFGGGGKGACHGGISSAFLSLSPSLLSACAAEWGCMRQPKLSGSLARCATPGHNNALRSPAASEQHDDEGQAVPHCTIALLGRPVVSSRWSPCRFRGSAMLLVALSPL